ncbi:DUF982 domain-containing protein [Mesorhizobium sp. B2-4-9]|nr:DUF982 domain-containing protein [Mesorhizobium sp. B2-5-2]TPL23946.1 DUF982 domain-containing protein [Mesorhizobium sp. B2-4-7]TPL26184.1 DUF982 domain-containing protein [Mesorhizobium sp. B2-4-9]TPL38756.1 DUF982 domain-containing protein [Mesorhizobium sp. B2-4-5]TPM73906.1 DUF982 domain-containing protein [Mesorhizobium sp. B2-1-6]TPN74885.1 DUF982 domain-containing protein [Mesorhizobium sp. B1-1-2]
MGAGFRAARNAKVTAVGTMKTGSPLKVCLDGHVEVIDGVAEAADFLQRWPIERRGHVYRSALNACSAAIAAQISHADAMKAFTGFARVTRILAGDDGRPAMPDAISVRIPKQGHDLPK